MSTCLERGLIYTDHLSLWRSVQRLSVRKRAAECPALEPTSHTWRAGWCPITARASPRRPLALGADVRPSCAREVPFDSSEGSSRPRAWHPRCFV